MAAAYKIPSPGCAEKVDLAGELGVIGDCESVTRAWGLGAWGVACTFFMAENGPRIGRPLWSGDEQ